VGAVKVNRAGLNLTTSLASKLASIVVHADEGTDPGNGEMVDIVTLRGLVDDPEVRNWLKVLGPLAPVKR
jgi:hypothetical protein